MAADCIMCGNAPWNCICRDDTCQRCKPEIDRLRADLSAARDEQGRLAGIVSSMNNENAALKKKLEALETTIGAMIAGDLHRENAKLREALERIVADDRDLHDADPECEIDDHVDFWCYCLKRVAQVALGKMNPGT